MNKRRQGRKTMGIPLTQGQVAIVDAADWWWLSKYKWYAQWNKGTKSFYAQRNIRLPAGKWTIVQMHREIIGAQKGELVDHRNHKTLDNRGSENLRLCTAAQNAWNQGIRSSNTSGVKGVCWNKNAQKWQASVRFKGKRYHLGCFDSLKTADKACRKARKKFHGEFAHE